MFNIARLLLFICFFISANGCINNVTENYDDSAQPGFVIKGLSMVAPVKPIDKTAMQPIIDVNAGSISIMPYAFCNQDNPVVKFKSKGGWWGESDEGVITCIKLAHEKNLTVMLKPHLWVSHGTFTGDFRLHTERDWQLWENSYREYTLNFANIDDSLKAEIFCIGTELGATIKHRPQFWDSLINRLKQTYHGKLTYAANWDEYKKVPFWEKLDYIGIDAYFPLSSDKTPSIELMQEEWKEYVSKLEEFSLKHNRKILFTEYGYRNVDYTGDEPWKENKGNQNDKAQTNAFEAFYRSFTGKKWFMGGYVWKWYADSLSRPGEPIDFTPQNKPAEKVVAKWYSK